MVKNKKNKKFGNHRMVNIPSTRYVGSKQKIVDWIWEQIKELDFNTFLDAFGGSSVVGYYAKTQNKEVTYNDILKANYLIGLSLIENNSVKLSDEDMNFILNVQSDKHYPNFIQRTFRDIYYTNDENRWLDRVISNIRDIENKYKQSIAFNSLFQSCIVKRPFNLFHRKNLYVRFADVKRNFGNKKTWDTPFTEHFKRFVNEINSLVIDNNKNNKSLNLDVFDLPTDYDLVYIDTPYFSSHSGIGVDYRDFYHFLEGITVYDEWEKFIDKKSKHKRLIKEPSLWNNKNEMINAFDRLFNKFKDSTLVVSYREGGIPTKEKMIELLKKYKNDVKVKEKKFKYVLSHNGSKELLFIAKD